jgi:hypothetical protein
MGPTRVVAVVALNLSAPQLKSFHIHGLGDIISDW